MALPVCISVPLAPRHSPRTLGIASVAKARDFTVKTRVVQIASCLCVLLMFIAVPSPMRAEGAEKPKIYNESANGDKQLADATVIARRERKHILLQFGANWCGWCLKLHKLFERDKPIHEELSTNYVLVLIDVNQGHNKEFGAKWGADKHGIPFLVVLNRDGKTLSTKDTSDLEEGDHHSREKVLAFLKAWEPGGVGGFSVELASNPKITFIRSEDSVSGGGLVQAYFQARNSTEDEILCRVHVQHKAGDEESVSFNIPAKGMSPFSFRFRPGDAPKITGEVLGPVSRFTVPIPNEFGAANRGQPVRSETNQTSSAAAPGR